jgi:hypothetical protein
MAVEETKISLSTGDEERVLQDSAIKRKWEVVSQADPVTGATYKGSTETTLLAVLAAIQAGSTGVTWPLPMTLLLADPAPVADKVLLYALSDGNVTPNNLITVKMMMPDGSSGILWSMTV